MRFGLFDEGGMGGIWKLKGPPSASDSSKNTGSSGQEADYKEVVIVGNGPSAISLSYMLSGSFPYYGDAVHPIDFLHRRLGECRTVSLFHQDLRCLSEGLEGRSDNPVSVLFDTLNHVDADLGVEAPSFLRWVRHHGKEIDHVVLGRGMPGGSWQYMEPNALTLSLSHWMELPNLNFKEWEHNRIRSKSTNMGGKQSRALVGDIAEYFREYVRVQQLEKYFRNYSVVTSVQKLPEDLMMTTTGAGDRSPPSIDKPDLWEVRGYCGSEQTLFRYVTPRVVLATGIHDVPKRLQVPGEHLPFVLHSVAQLEGLLANQRFGPHSDPLMVVGAGLTAADAIISARFYGVPVAHVFRRGVDDPSLIFRKLPENMYPEYHKVYQMMSGNGSRYRNYCAHPKHRILEFLPGRKVRLENPDTSLVLRVSHVLVLIGSQANLGFLVPDAGARLGADPSRPIDCKRNAVVVDAFTHESVREKGLYALGPLVGDNFVRFIQGGALAVARHIHQQQQQQQCDVSASVAASSVHESRTTAATSREPVSSRPHRLVRSFSRISAEGSDGVELAWNHGSWSPARPDDHRAEETEECHEVGCEDGVQRLRWLWIRKQKRRRRRFSHPFCDKLDAV